MALPERNADAKAEHPCDSRHAVVRGADAARD
jgi:hypothetical protein